MDFDTALRIESRYLARLIVSPVAKNMINTFFSHERDRPGSQCPKHPRCKTTQAVGVLGAGMMAQAFTHRPAAV